MKKISSSQNKNKLLIDLFLILGFFLLPIAIFFLNSTNRPQLNINDVYFFIIVQLFFLLIITIISVFLYYIFFKKKISLIDFLVINSFIFFILFYFRKVLNFFSFFDQVFFLIDNIIVCLLYFFIYCFIFKSINKYKVKIKKFLTLYIIINFFILIITSIPKDNHDVKLLENNKITFDNNFDLSELNETSENYHVFIVILDAMINLKAAEKSKIIASEKDYKKKFKKNGFIYVDDFHANYPTTYLSVATLLNGIYPVTSNSPRYKNRENFFPGMFLHSEFGLTGKKELSYTKENNKKNNFYNILKKISGDFFWVGNYWGRCYPNEFVQCLSSDKYSYYYSKVYPMYFYSFFRYFFDIFDQENSMSSVFNSYDINSKSIDSLAFLSDTDFYKKSKAKLNKTTFFLIHVLSPHPSPYVFFENCTNYYEPDLLDNFEKTILPHELELYSNAYKCLIDLSLKWSNQISDINSKNIIVILGDHGYDPYPDNNDYEKLSNTLNNVFLAVKIPAECKSLKFPKSHVNIMRFILNCSQNANLKYLENKKFISRYEGHENFGLVVPFE